METPYLSDDLPSLILRLIVSAVLSSFIGWERERRGQPAGLRTHNLVCIGATLITVVSESYSDSGDPGRITAQIVSGIGFLGAGTILVHGHRIRGLTTAASIWVAAAIGIATGRGGEFFILAAAATAIVMFVLIVLDHLEDRLIEQEQMRQLIIRYALGDGSDRDIVTLFQTLGIPIQSVERLHTDEEGCHLTVFSLRLPPKRSASEVNTALLDLPWVRSFEWDSPSES
jgi:putative Mg2+ transporter-C (MgtC) family protein